MNAASTDRLKGLVLAIHPTSRGFGWIVFETPLVPLDWGLASAAPSRPARLATRFERILKRYEPAVLVLEEFEGPSGRADRVQKVCREIIHLATFKGMDVSIFLRVEVQKTFGRPGTLGRHEIAQIIAEQIEVLSPRLLRKRKHYDGEQRGLALFDATAVALTYYANASR